MAYPNSFIHTTSYEPPPPPPSHHAIPFSILSHPPPKPQPNSLPPPSEGETHVSIWEMAWVWGMGSLLGSTLGEFGLHFPSLRFACVQKEKGEGGRRSYVS